MLSKKTLNNKKIRKSKSLTKSKKINKIKKPKYGSKKGKNVKVSKKKFTGRRKYFTNGKKKQLGGDPCEYVKVEGVNLPQINIPDQYAKLNNDCDSASSTTSASALAVDHPNIRN